MKCFYKVWKKDIVHLGELHVHESRIEHWKDGKFCRNGYMFVSLNEHGEYGFNYGGIESKEWYLERNWIYMGIFHDLKKLRMIKLKKLKRC